MRLAWNKSVAAFVACAALIAWLGAPALAEDTSVHGRVMGQTEEGDHLGPVPGAKVEFLNQGGGAFASVVADDGGYYRIEQLSAPAYAFRVTAAGFRDEDAKRSVAVSAEGAHVFDFVLTKGTTPTDPPAETPAGSLVVRTFFEKDGARQPLPNVDLRLRRTDGGPVVHRVSGPQGRGIQNLPAGEWRVSGSTPGGESVVHPEPVTIVADKREIVTLVLPEPPPEPPRAPPPAPPANDGGKACFYGDVAAAKRVVFVVDKSNSMQGGKFDEASKELMRSLEYLTDQQQFYVIFFSDAMHPMFEPDAPADLVPATADNRKRLEQFAGELSFKLGTRAHPAMERALAMKPDVVYLLGDGAFTDDTGAYLLGLEGNTVPICTVAFKSRERGATVMKRIAEKHHGRFMYVQ